MSSNFNWAFWTAGSLLGAIALLLFYWSLVKDRSRGRRRCPKCWYDMSGTPGLVCSECGRSVKRESKFFKTRRRWRWAAVAFMLMLAGGASMVTPAIRSKNWPSLLPSTVLVLIERQGAKLNPLIDEEVKARLRAGSMWDWQINLLFRRSVIHTNPNWAIQFLSHKQWPQDSDVFYATRINQGGTSISWLDLDTLRLRVTPRVANGQELIIQLNDDLLPFGGWRDQCSRIGRSAAGDQKIEFDIKVDYLRRCKSGPSRWIEVSKRDGLLRVNVGGMLAEAMEPVASPEIDDLISKRVWCAVYAESVRVLRTFPRIDELGEEGALGLVFELWRDDRILASTSGWWGNNGAKRTSELLLWDHGQFDTRQMKSDGDQVKWSLHVHSDAELALRAFDDRRGADPDSNQYWSGEFVIPLRLADSQSYAVPQKPMPRWSAWVWDWDNSRTQR